MPRPLRSTLFPYTTLFRSRRRAGVGAGRGAQAGRRDCRRVRARQLVGDRKSTRLNSSHVEISYAVFCLKKKTIQIIVCAHSNKVTISSRSVSYSSKLHVSI